ncbi:hypothetical protein A2U01_0115419, partial [Trifolium medium]|nr:hypothetical protein [Trifolium medium]
AAPWLFFGFHRIPFSPAQLLPSSGV